MKKIFSTILFVFAGLSLAGVLFFGIRQFLAKLAIERELRSGPISNNFPQVTSHLEIIPLYDEASVSADFISGHGVSYLIRTDSSTILLDVGGNPDELPVAPFMQNMQKLDIDWDEIDRIVISHSHPDHIGGTQAWKNHTVSIGDLELPVALGDRLIFVPTPVKFKGAIHATIPTLAAPDVATTGVVSYLEVWPLSLFAPKGGEQALVVHVAGHGLVLITGCGHPGLEHLVVRAESLYGEKVVGVVGGLHYLNAKAEELQPQIRFLQSRQLELVALSSHDSGPVALSAFESVFPNVYQTLTVGEAILFP